MRGKVGGEGERDVTRNFSFFRLEEGEREKVGGVE